MYQYILVQNQTTVLIGPIFWQRYRRFQAEVDQLYEDGELSQQFIVPPIENGYINIGQGFEIFPIVNSTGINYDSVYEQPCGPFYIYDNTNMTASEEYTNQQLDMYNIQQNLKGVAASVRYNKEVSGTTVTISNIVYNIPTDRNSKTTYANLLQSTGPTDIINYKIDGNFLSITGNDIQNIMDAINSHVQNQFDWEKSISDSIDSANTVSDLQSIQIT